MFDEFHLSINILNKYMPRTSEQVDKREESKVDRLIRKAYEETRGRLTSALAPVDGDFKKVLATLQEVRNLIEVLIGQKLGDHPVCNTNGPREFFAEAQKARSTEIKELVSGERLAALLAHYDEVAAVVKPLRVAIARVNELLGIEDEETEVPAGRGRRGARAGVGAVVEKGGKKGPQKAILEWIAGHGAFKITEGKVKKLGYSQAALEKAIAMLLAERKIVDTGGNASGRRYGFAKGQGGVRHGGNGVGEGASRYAQCRAEIQSAILNNIDESGVFINTGAFCSKIGCDSITSRKVIAGMVEAGLLTKEGNNRATKYHVTSKGKAAIDGGNASAKA